MSLCRFVLVVCVLVVCVCEWGAAAMDKCYLMLPVTLGTPGVTESIKSYKCVSVLGMCFDVCMCVSVCG